MEIFATDLFSATFELSSFDMKKFVNWAVQDRTAASQKGKKVLKTMTRGRKTENVVPVFVSRLPSFCKKQVRNRPVQYYKR